MLVAILVAVPNSTHAQQLADSLYSRACAASDLQACITFGLMLELGEGVAEDKARSLEFFEIACAGGAPLGCANLGRGLFSLAETPADSSRALDLLGRSCSEGIAFACPSSPDEQAGREDAAGRVIVSVLEAESERRVQAARVLVGDRLQGLTNSGGRVEFVDVPAGLQRVEVGAFGYEPVVADVAVEPGRTLDVSVSLTTDPIELAPLEVHVRSPRLERVGYYARSQTGLGFTMSGDALRATGRPRVADVIDRQPGIYTRRTGSGSVAAFTRRGRVGLLAGPCQLSVYLNGSRTSAPPSSPPYNLDDITLEMVEAIEVHEVATAPIGYQPYGDGCGVILIWTR